VDSLHPHRTVTNSLYVLWAVQLQEYHWFWLRCRLHPWNCAMILAYCIFPTLCSSMDIKKFIVTWNLVTICCFLSPSLWIPCNCILFLNFIYLFIWDRILLCIPGWSGTHNPPASASQVLELQTWTIIPGHATLCLKASRMFPYFSFLCQNVTFCNLNRLNFTSSLGII
jgi:hypothetical protein